MGQRYVTEYDSNLPFLAFKTEEDRHTNITTIMLGKKQNKNIHTIFIYLIFKAAELNI